ncbi:1,4-dihydroxy-2-naphthoate polyprenyltransferase [Herbiconiux solani]|uniref:1,4-dihydroxy-2-naphthoate polyprenyltransferase n=1 Tax=Herbiconiux solani TaxID=661329 RepID=UPI000A01AAE9|nr:1,4-dihydroxy-2-naphthoate polyprenyltransferase [Herbiconiux solani]
MTTDDPSLEHDGSPGRGDRRPVSAADWISGARPRTLTLAAVPVVIGTAAASARGDGDALLAVLALLTALLLQVGVNYSNDYSDGVRGTDKFRLGPARLTGSGIIRPRSVLAVALAFFALGAVAGAVIVVLTQQWWMLLVGVAAIAAAWTYTGGRRPYGYAGLGEVAVFVFFGVVATLGTEFIQAGDVSVPGLIGAVAAGSFACGVLMVNNIRDIAPDTQAGKRTLAVRLGAPRARVAYAVFLVVPYVGAGVVAVAHPAVLLVVLSLPLTVRAIVLGTRRSTSLELITALKLTSLSALVFACALAVGLVLTP